MRIEREYVTHRFIHARPAITAWQCRDVEEYGITSFRRRDKSEPTFVVPFCDFSLATHFLFSSDLTLPISRRAGPSDDEVIATAVSCIGLLGCGLDGVQFSTTSLLSLIFLLFSIVGNYPLLNSMGLRLTIFPRLDQICFLRPIAVRIILKFY